MDELKDIRKIHIGADHAGFEYKEELKGYLEKQDYEVVDHGAPEMDPEDDYPDYILPVAIAVHEEQDSVGIILGGSGQGEAIVANRVPGIRAAVFYGPTGDESIVVLSRQHNDSNILSLGTRFISLEEAKEAVDLWLETSFSGDERHIRRIVKIDNLDQVMVDDGGYDQNHE